MFSGNIIFEYLSQVIVLVQLFCHLPFIFYIAKEETFVLADEIMRKSMSRMIDDLKLLHSDSKKYISTKSLD